MMRIFIAHEDDTFRQHILEEHNDRKTRCGIIYDSLPDIVGSNGEVWIDDKPWYYDHDRDDVTECVDCEI